MRYLKVLFLACLIFLILVFFFQNQAILSTKTELKIDLFFIPPMTSIPLPFYFLLICSFFIGILLALLLLIWDRLSLSARIMKDKWQIQNLSSKLAQAEKLARSQHQTTFWGRMKYAFNPDEGHPLGEDRPNLAKSNAPAEQPKPAIAAQTK